jgi:NADH dehydrogenase/NADH:ubiquinone oxidoreductase subunit G
MGALTLKSFPFELRGWDIEKFESIDPTDGFGSSTRVYISKQQIIQIEPDHSEKTSKAWLSDKGRQFFDGIFGAWNNKSDQNESLTIKKESWQQTVKTLLKTLYLFEHCSTKIKKNYFLTIVFENLGIETLSLLKIMEKEYPFIKLRRAEAATSQNDLEFDFQLNTATNPNQLKSSSLCLLIGNNPRYEGYHLNLDLRQRYLKGNFKCLVLGSLTDLTFPTISLGTNLKVLKEIAEGNSFVCQDLKTAKNSLLIFGDEINKRADGSHIAEMFKLFKFASIFNQTWNGINTLNSNLSGVGTQTIADFLPLKATDLEESNSFYFINVNAQVAQNLKKITETKLLGYNNIITKNQPDINSVFLDQNSYVDINKPSFRNFCKDYHFLPVKMFYENKETFINAEGLIKRTNKLITKTKTRESWKLLRNLAKRLNSSYESFNVKVNQTLLFDASKQSNFINFLNFQYCAVEKLDSITQPLTVQNQPFFMTKANMTFKKMPLKINSTKLKYWIDDFFTGGKDEYSRNSLVMANCSKISRTQSTNFF